MEFQQNPLDFYWNFPKIADKMVQKKSGEVSELWLHSSESPVPYKMHSAKFWHHHQTCPSDHFHQTLEVKISSVFQWIVSRCNCQNTGNKISAKVR
jgi:hypothetical protein